MSVTTAANKTVRPAVAKDASMRIQKDMMGAHYDRMTAAPETGEKIWSICAISQPPTSKTV